MLKNKKVNTAAYCDLGQLSFTSSFQIFYHYLQKHNYVVLPVNLSVEDFCIKYQ